MIVNPIKFRILNFTGFPSPLIYLFAMKLFFNDSKLDAKQSEEEEMKQKENTL